MARHETPSSSKALSQYAAQREELLDAYFQDTKLLQVLQAFLTKLASAFKTRCVLPASPYPRLLQLIRQNEIERSLVLNGVFPAAAPSSGTQPEFLLHEQQQQQRTSDSSSSASANQFCLCTTKELLPKSLWGFLPVMERLDPTQLGRRVDAICEMHPTWFAAKDGNLSKQDDEGYKITVFAAFVGHGNGLTLAEYPIVEIEQHVVITGELLEKAMGVFARQLYKFLHDLLVTMTKSPKSMGSSEPNAVTRRSTIGCCGICIVTPPHSGTEHGNANSLSGSDDPQRQLWTVECVSGNRNAFVSAVKIAIVNNASFAITSFSGTGDDTPTGGGGSKRDPRATICQTRQRFFFHFAAENAKPSGGVKTLKAPAAQRQQQNRSFLTGTRVLESGVFLSARGALEIATRVHNAAALTTGNGSAAATAKAQAGKKSSEIYPSELNSTQNQPNSNNKSLYHKTATSLIEAVIANLQRHTSGIPDEFRQWTKRFASSIAFTFLRIALRNQVLIDLLESLEGEADDRSVTAVELLASHFAATSSQMDALLEHARVGSSSSLLKSVGAFLQTLWSEAGASVHLLITTTTNNNLDSDDSEDRDSALLMEQLQRVNELLLVVARVAARDFTKLVQSHHNDAGNIEIGSDEKAKSTLVDPEEQEIDVPRALQIAVEEREYPPLIAFECVFAQFLVDSCVDVAFESAVMNIVAFHLPPNPFIELSLKMRVFAVRHRVWASPLGQHKVADYDKQSNSRVSALNGGNQGEVILKLETKDPSRNLYGSNRKILEILDPDQVWRAHSWLQSYHIFRQHDFQPSKGSYSVQTFHSLLVCHPLVQISTRTSQPPSTENNVNLLAFTPLLQELEVLEHVVVEGKELTQALVFFAEAMTLDLRRLTGLRSPHQALLVNPIEASLVGPLGQIVSDVDYLNNDDNAAIYQLLQEATRAKCVLQLGITLFTEPPSVKPSEIGGGGDSATICVVRKSYVFHHKPTEIGGDNQVQQDCVSQLLAFRIQRFGVFFASENATFVLEECVHTVLATSEEGVAREHWTPFARLAIDNDDLLLKYELDFGVPSGSPIDFSTPYHGTADHKRGLLLQRLTTHSSILHLYSIETTCSWLLRHLQQRLKDQQSRAKLPVSQLPRKSLILILEMLVLQVEEILLPLNIHMRYVEGLNELLAAFRQTINSLKSPPNSSPAPPMATMQTSNSANSMIAILPDVVQKLRQTCLLVLYARFSYQQDFFANY